MVLLTLTVSHMLLVLVVVLRTRHRRHEVLIRREPPTLGPHGEAVEGDLVVSGSSLPLTAQVSRALLLAGVGRTGPPVAVEVHLDGRLVRPSESAR